MPKRIGKCTNYASCQLAFQNADIEPEGEFVCPECGQPLQDVTPAAPDRKLPKNLFLFGGIGLGVLVVIILAMLIITKCSRETTPGPPEVPATTTPAITPEETPTATPAQPTVSPIPTLFPTATPAPTPTPFPTSTPTPAPTAFPTVTPTPTPTVQPTTTPTSAPTSGTEELTTKTEVLQRVDLIPNLSVDQREALYRRVNEARAMEKLITVPFGYAQKGLPASAVQKLCEAASTPRVKELMQDPTVVFVILGFADTTGSIESGLRLSTERAETVVDSLRRECGVLNLMQAVGMGSTDILGKDNTAKNRVAEVWAVLP